MKKTVSILLTVCILLTVASAACAEQTQQNAVRELYSMDVFYTDDVGNARTYSFHVPQINASTAAAEEINAEIAERFGSQVEWQLKYMEGGFSLWLFRTDWEAYWNGSQLFLLVTADENGDLVDYGAYGYDFETGSRVTNDRILEQFGISKEEYLESLEEEVTRIFEDVYTPIPEGVKTELTREKLLEDTLKRLDPEQPMFINGSGEIATVIEIVTVAGAGLHSYIATPFSERSGEKR